MTRPPLFQPAGATTFAKAFARVALGGFLFVRLFFQPVLVAWALWSSGAWEWP